MGISRKTAPPSQLYAFCTWNGPRPDTLRLLYHNQISIGCFSVEFKWKFTFYSRNTFAHWYGCETRSHTAAHSNLNMWAAAPEILPLDRSPRGRDSAAFKDSCHYCHRIIAPFPGLTWPCPDRRILSGVLTEKLLQVIFHRADTGNGKVLNENLCHMRAEESRQSRTEMDIFDAQI